MTIFHTHVSAVLWPYMDENDVCDGISAIFDEIRCVLGVEKGKKGEKKGIRSRSFSPLIGPDDTTEACAGSGDATKRDRYRIRTFCERLRAIG